MNLEPGHGKSTLMGSTNVVITDKENHWLYGWTNYEKAKATDSGALFVVVNGIDLETYVGFIGGAFPEVQPLLKPLIGTSTIRFEDLLAIDRSICITQVHATEMEAFQARYEAGEILDSDGNPIFPTKYTAIDRDDE